MHPLYLTAKEKELFGHLSASLQEGWDVKEETLKSYESDEDLKVRASIAAFDEHPAVQKLLKTIQEGGDIGHISLDAIPQHVFEELMFTIGARGIDRFIRALLSQCKSDEDLQGVAGLCSIRHALLESNRSISYA